eukprot:g46810.t1
MFSMGQGCQGPSWRGRGVPMGQGSGGEELMEETKPWKGERKLCAHPCLEIYRGDVIYFMCPLARQGDFYVPELKEADKKQIEEEADDAHTDT